MGFWGIEVKPGKPHPYHPDNAQGILHITQATLGVGSSKERSIVQISVGHKSPIFLCSLIPNKIESCPLNLEIEDNELVAFSVIGPQSIHLSGYFVADDGDALGDDYELDSFGEDIAQTESDESSEYDNEDECADGFIDDSDLDMYHSSLVPNSGVVIEEIVNDEKPTDGSGQAKRPKKKNQIINLENSGNSHQQIGIRGGSDFPVLESEDEDGFPISTTHKSNSNTQKVEKKTKKKGDDAPNLKRKDESVDQDGRPKGGLLEKKKKKQKKKKNHESEGATELTRTAETTEKQNISTMESGQKQTETESSQIRTFPNGLVIEELSMGKPDGKRASPGKQVSVHYTGKLKKDGKIFDSNVGKAPFKFRLGVGQVIKGWDVGVNGMRTGDKRRITIPPSMGYGAKRTGPIPPHSWLVFDVELVNVR
ncbi:Peptidylprolyl isomerase [Quillaja saponaria]|uniref:FK506-binding protein n=1 Tax=Quillaja saponaria TaxID=32244 RepID=A0AAD7M5L0_QUISA|nr:Peptidylprolyl isomerase [Quillaja saponaria]